MIYIEQTTTEQELTLPRAVAVPGSGDWCLTLTNSTTLAVTSFEDLAVTVDGMVCTMDVTLPGLSNGQYDYQLTRGETTVSQGLAYIGADGTVERVQYNPNIDIIQYNG